MKERLDVILKKDLVEVKCNKLNNNEKVNQKINIAILVFAVLF